MSKSFRRPQHSIWRNALCISVKDAWLERRLHAWARKRRHMIKTLSDEESSPILPAQAGSKWPSGGKPLKHGGLKLADSFTIKQYRSGRSFPKLKAPAGADISEI